MFESHSLDPSRNWPVRQPSEIVADLTNGTINGVSLGSPFDALSILGPADEQSAMIVSSCDDDSCEETEYITHYFLKVGLSVDTRFARFDGFELHFAESDEIPCAPYAGRIVFNAKQFSAQEVRTRAEVEKFFGAPTVFGQRDDVARNSRYSFADYVFPKHICTVTYDESESVDEISCAVKKAAWDSLRK